MINSIKVEGIYLKDWSIFKEKDNKAIFVINLVWNKNIKDLKTLRTKRYEYYPFKAIATGIMAKELYNTLQDRCVYIIEGQMHFFNTNLNPIIKVEGKDITPPYIDNLKRIEKRTVLSQHLKNLGVTKGTKRQRVILDYGEGISIEEDLKKRGFKAENVFERNNDNSMKFKFGGSNNKVTKKDNIKRLEKIGLTPIKD